MRRLQLSLLTGLAGLLSWSAASAEETYPYPAYESLLDCYVGFLNSKGVMLGAKDSEVKRWDVPARRQCTQYYSALVRQAGAPKAERAWRGLWSENAVRD